MNYMQVSMQSFLGHRNWITEVRIKMAYFPLYSIIFKCLLMKANRDRLNFLPNLNIFVAQGCLIPCTLYHQSIHVTMHANVFIVLNTTRVGWTVNNILQLTLGMLIYTHLKHTSIAIIAPQIETNECTMLKWALSKQCIPLKIIAINKRVVLLHPWY